MGRIASFGLILTYLKRHQACSHRIGMKKKFILAGLSTAIFMSAGLIFAKTTEPPDDPSRPGLSALRKEGQLFSLRLAPGEPMRIYVVGREEASFDFSKLSLNVRRLRPSPEKSLNLKKEAGFYTLDTDVPSKSDSELEVTTLLNDKKEVFHFQLKTKAP